MSLATRCKREFSQAARSKGDSYCRRGRVTIHSSSDEELEARVQGSDSRPYVVTIDGSDPRGGLAVACTCPHYDGGNLCKHLWATLLAADEQGFAIPGRGELILIHRDDEDDDYDYDHSYGDVRDEYVMTDFGRVRLLSPASRPAKNGPARAWHAELAALPRGRSDAPLAADRLGRARRRDKRALFVLDVGASFAAGAIILNLFQQEQLKDGQWGKTKALKAVRNELAAFSPDDQRRLALALGNYTGAPWGHGNLAPLHWQASLGVSQVELVAELHEHLLPELCAGGRFGWVLGGAQAPDEARPLAWDGGAAWRFRLAVAADDKKKQWTVRGELARGEQLVPLGEPVLLLSSGIVVFQDAVARLAPEVDWRWLMLLRQRGEVCVAYAQRQELLSELWAADNPDQTALPANLQVQVETAAPRGCLTVHAAPSAAKRSGYASQDLLYADVHFEYGGERVPLADDRQAVVNADRAWRRDPAAEEMLVAQLIGLRLNDKKDRYGFDQPGDVEFPQHRLGEVVERLTHEGWQVEAEGRLVRRAGAIHATVTSGIDWFDLETAVDFDGASVSLPQLLAALRSNERLVQLDDGSQGILPQEWLERFAPLAEFAKVDGDRLRFRPAQALLLDALLADRDADVQLAVDRHFSRMRQKLQSFAGVKPRKAPSGFRGELRTYQEEGLGWLAFLADFNLGGCLADDMGLGKTVQVLAWLAARRRSRRGQPKRPTLVVAPKSVVFNWQLEAERFAPKLAVLNYTGTARQSRADQLADADLVLTTYGTLRKDVEALAKIRFDYAILDEAHAIKNDKSLSAKACRLLDADHRLALTGTPVENHLGDLWSLFEFLNPGLLGRSSVLRSFVRNSGDDAEALEALRRGLAPFILRRTKVQVLKELPEKTEQTLHVELLPADRKRYNQLRDHYRASLLKRVSDDGMNAARMHVLEALLRLRQAACHPGLIDKSLVDKPSAKLQSLLDQLAEVAAEGHKALIFSQFTSLLAILRPQLAARGVAHEYLDGRTRDRQARVERFQSDPQCSVFLISLKAGGTGLNLTAADYVFLLDPWWNPAVEAQAIDRAHRIGQQRPVFAYRLVARDTVEEKIIELQQQKRDLADAIISGDKSVLTSLSLEDLQSLLT